MSSTICPNCQGGDSFAQFACDVCQGTGRVPATPTPEAEVTHSSDRVGLPDPAPQAQPASGERQELYNMLNTHFPFDCPGNRKNPCPVVKRIEEMLATARTEARREGAQDELRYLLNWIRTYGLPITGNEVEAVAADVLQARLAELEGE